MKLATLKTGQGLRACALHQGKYVDINASDSSLPATLRELIALGPDGVKNIARRFSPDRSRSTRKTRSSRR